jgi:hypothetical protein
MKLKRPVLFIISLIFLGVLFVNLTGLRNGIINVTKKNSDFGCGCHGESIFPNTQTHVDIIGPDMMEPGDTAVFQVVITSDTIFHVAGTDIAAYYGELFVNSADTGLQRMRDTVVSMDYELTHTWPKPVVNDSVVFTFTYIAPNMNEVYDTLYANGNAADNDGEPFLDKWNYANNKIVHITTTSIGNYNGLAGDFKLEQNYPNPFNPSTNISFSLLRASNVSLSVYDLNGREVATLINNEYRANGNYSATFDAASYKLSSGVYFYKLSADGFTQMKKMVLVK